MIQLLIIKLFPVVIRAIRKAVQKKKKIKGLDNLVKINDYVNKPNELDLEVKKMWKEINILKKDTHPVADWVCLECGCKATKKKKK